MPTVMIRCPNTGKYISTGIETDPDSFRNFPDVLARARCLLCGVEHTWWKREASLDETPTEADAPTCFPSVLRSA
jgi:hypothetical protein